MCAVMSLSRSGPWLRSEHCMIGDGHAVWLPLGGERRYHTDWLLASSSLGVASVARQACHVHARASAWHVQHTHIRDDLCEPPSLFRFLNASPLIQAWRTLLVGRAGGRGLQRFCLAPVGEMTSVSRLLSARAPFALGVGVGEAVALAGVAMPVEFRTPHKQR